MRYTAEYDDGTRVNIPVASYREYPIDVGAAYRECARLLRDRPTAHRVEAYDGNRYVTKAQRGTPISGPELLAANETPPACRYCGAVNAPLVNGQSVAQPCCADVAACNARRQANGEAMHGPFCFGTCCMPTPRDEDGEGEEAT